MKKFFLTGIFLICGILCQYPVYAGVWITAPLDSRPVGMEYLENLVTLGGDEFLTVGKEILDEYPAQGESHAADDKKVRQEVEQLVAAHNDTETTVVIHSSSYITGGLVGSRSADSYENWSEKLEDLHRLVSTYQNPTYYINLAMPRNLPETRLNAVWPDTLPLRGLGYYYLKYHKDTPDKETIENQFAMVTPSQFLMEYSYVENKKQELGKDALAKWEQDFLSIFEAKYKGQDPYSAYIEKYRMPYLATSNMVYHLLNWQREGLIDEIVFSNDDLELPTSIAWFYANKKEDWIQEENGAAVKYSYARTYMTTGINSIYSFLKKEIGEEEVKKAMRGQGESINFIFGMDEVPQLIYARDLARRTRISADFSVKGILPKEGVASYDVLGAAELVDNAVHFVSVGEKTKPFSLYVFDYGTGNQWAGGQTASQMRAEWDNAPVGLIELFDNRVIFGGGNNYLFRSLLESGELKKLSAYSAWNTNANAIGLGIAHSQVYAITAESSSEVPTKEQLKVLGQHVFEDGIYTAKLKRQLGAEGYVPTVEERVKSRKLLELLETDKVLPALGISDSSVLVGYGFPWGRVFDCFIEIEP